MKQLIAVMLALALLLCGCVTTPTEPAPTEPPAPTAPQSTEPQLYFPSLPDIGSYQKAEARPRMFGGYTEDAPVRDDYGTLIPYAGALRDFSLYYDEFTEEYIHCKYGLCTVDGVIVTDPVYNSVERQGSRYLLTKPPLEENCTFFYSEDDLYICAVDGSDYRCLPYLEDGSYPLISSLDRVIKRTWDAYSYLAQLCTLDGEPLTGVCEHLYRLGDSDYFLMDTGEYATVIDKNGVSVLEETQDRIEYGRGILVMQKGSRVRVTDLEFNELGSFRTQGMIGEPVSPTLLRIYGPGLGPYVDLNGRNAGPSGYIHWDGFHYITGDEQTSCIYDENLTLVKQISTTHSWNSYSKRFLRDYQYSTAAHAFHYYIYDLAADTLSEYERVYGACSQDGIDHLFVDRDGVVYDLEQDAPLMPGRVHAMLDTPAGWYLAVQDGNRLLTVDLAGNILTEFPVEQLD